MVNLLCKEGRAEPRRYSGTGENHVGHPGGEVDHAPEKTKCYCLMTECRQHLGNYMRGFGLYPKGSMKPPNDFKQASDLIRFV